MDYNQLEPLIGKCRLIVTEENFRLKKFLRNKEMERTRNEAVIAIKEGRKDLLSELLWAMDERYEFYLAREKNGSLFNGDPEDIELFFFYLLAYAKELGETKIFKLDRLIHFTRALINRTHDRRSGQQPAAKH
jgi:hypothetical protein